MTQRLGDLLLWGISRRVMYLAVADKYSRALASRLIGANQPVIRFQIGFLASRCVLLPPCRPACLALFHDQFLLQAVTDITGPTLANKYAQILRPAMKCI